LRDIDLSRSYKDLSEAFAHGSLSRRLCIVIDGPTLAFAFSDTKVANAFFKLGLMASSVICCRVSPK
jgi:magnesium-transporting ATPase (P-type)